MSTSELPTLLSVADNPSVRYWIRKQLEKEFFIIETSTKDGALLQARTTRLDFLIVDSLLEDCDSLVLCIELKKILLTLTPILLITGRLKQSFLNEALEAGVTDFLSNRLDEEELQTKVASIRKGRSLRGKTKEASGTLMKKREFLPADFLKNRVALEGQALDLLKEANRSGTPVSSLLIKVDHSEEMGDDTLSTLSNLIQKFIPKTDLLISATDGRFVVLLKGSTPFEGREIAEKLRKKISETPFSTAQPTVSIVVSSLAGTEKDFKQVVDSSFKALKKTQDLIISVDEE
jgi:diguanylate cyclase (GGDEF)-like protein